jgi:hypothetical protein
MPDEKQDVRQIVAEIERRSKRARAAMLIGALVIAASMLGSMFYLNGLRKSAEARAEKAEEKVNAIADKLELAKRAFEAGNTWETSIHLEAAIWLSEQAAQTVGVAIGDAPAAPVTVRSDQQAPVGSAGDRLPAVSYDQRIFIQFAGRIARDDVIAFNQSLRGAGWRVEGSSGERTANAVGFNEVRYSMPEDREAAEALKVAAMRSGLPGSPVKVQQVGIIKPGTLELWISN